MPNNTQPSSGLVVRIVSIDYYMTRPSPKVDLSYAPLEGTAIDQVPVVRIFGSTPSGQKACVHLHKVVLHNQRAPHTQRNIVHALVLRRRFLIFMSHTMTASLMSLLKVRCLLWAWHVCTVGQLLARCIYEGPQVRPQSCGLQPRYFCGSWHSP